jgi:hypothetical protein
MNYHLKVLGDLLLKMDDGRYALTEKGKFASRLLLEFPDKKAQARIEVNLPRWVFVAGCLLFVVFVIGTFAAYVRGVITYSRMLGNVCIATSVLITFIVAGNARKISAKWSPNRQMLGQKIVSIVFGALVGATIFLTGGSLLLFGFETLLQSAGVRFVLFPFAWWLIISFVFGPIIGGVVGYLLYKKGKHFKGAYYNPFA